MKIKILVPMIISVLLALGWPADIHAEEVKLTAGGGKVGDWFGMGVSISGDYAIVGAPSHDDKKGAAYVFKHVGKSWDEQTKIVAEDGQNEDYFGWSVAISGDYAIVGAPTDDDKGKNTGSAYVFHREGTSWTQQAKLTPHAGPGPIGGGEFGFTVDMSGDYAIVGAHYDSWAQGAVYFYQRNGDSWDEQVKLVASDGARQDRLGHYVSISGDYAIAGAPRNDNKQGAAYIFKRDGDSWSEQTKLTASDGEADDWFSSVSISGNYAIVGANGDKDKGQWSGSAYIFKREGDSWIEQVKLIGSDVAAGDSFGESVSISGNYAIVGASLDDEKSGSIYTFLRRGDAWIEQTKLTASDVAVGDRFGTEPTISGNYTIVAAFNDNDATGSAYIYHCINDLSLPVEITTFNTTTFGSERSNSEIPEVVVPPAKPMQLVPKEFYLLQNYPNPFNPDTWLPYQLASDATVTIRIYNVKGQVVRELNLGRQEAGSYMTKDRAAYWDGRNGAGDQVASGAYFYSLEAGDFFQIRKMTVAK